MQAKIFAMWVLTNLEVICGLALIVSILVWNTSRGKTAETNTKKVKNVFIWIFTIVILGKFMLETDMIENISPILWGVDMLLANAFTAYLVVKYIIRPQQKGRR